MSTFKVEVVPIELEKHPNADSLSLVKVWGYTVVCKTENYENHNIAAYIPIDTVCGDVPEFEFLGEKRRIKAARLRGIYSEGLLVPPRPHWNVGDDVTEELKCVKWEEPEEREPIVGRPRMQTDSEPQPGWFTLYDGPENYKRYHMVLRLSEEVAITEKLHGANSRFAYWEDRLWTGSHKFAKKYDETNMWWKVAKKYDLEEKLKKFPGHILHGEVFGQVQDLKYGSKPGELFFRAFDISTIKAMRYLNYDEFVEMTDKMGIERVPLLYRGPWDPGLTELAEGKTTLPAENIKEGFVVKPVVERREHMGRVILKVISPAYHLRKGGTERH